MKTKAIIDAMLWIESARRINSDEKHEDAAKQAKLIIADIEDTRIKECFRDISSLILHGY